MTILNLQAYDVAIRAVCPIDGVSADGTIFFSASATPSQISAAQSVASSYVNAAVKNVIGFDVFISRWTDAEYALLMQKRAAAITVGNVTLVKQWDTAVAQRCVDLNTTAAQNFKAAMVSNVILTQARADAIFS